ncbi:hypothetical protein ACG9XS_06790 [Acinetobacter gyllenbergii]|uniref:hypothetical protein n=1 Tax=Acinetobacter TaxID=469 RepID=UPI0003BEA289|nr:MULTISPECIES: hypothetical protein [Acinetobacter]ESK48258.1 hypothetical protein F987_01743 [Acinetobacter gyllenbergii NIPH 230]MCH7294841.1 hypothetical protein [Acinetobacter higginsii]MDO3666567.1 hypothetical protein [Acinetobacter higginsii]
MFTILVEVMMSVFIANFKANEHPVINVMVRGFLISVVMFLLMVFLDISSGKESSIGLALVISVAGGVIISIGILMVEVFFNYIDRK